MHSHTLHTHAQHAHTNTHMHSLTHMPHSYHLTSTHTHTRSHHTHTSRGKLKGTNLDQSSQVGLKPSHMQGPTIIDVPWRGQRSEVRGQGSEVRGQRSVYTLSSRNDMTIGLNYKCIKSICRSQERIKKLRYTRKILQLRKNLILYALLPFMMINYSLETRNEVSI